MVRLSVSLLLSLTFTFIGYSQKNINSDEIVISGNRISIPISEDARSVEVFTQEEIARMPVTQIADVLQFAGGMDIRRRGTMGVQGDLSLRGSTFEQVVVLINGVKVLDPQTGHHILNLPLDLDIIKRIEIIKGPAARIYGQNAFAGAINIVTEVGDKDQLKLEGTAGSYDLLGISAGVTKVTKKQKLYLSVSKLKSDGYIENKDFDRNVFFVQDDITFDKKHTLTLLGSYIENGFGASNFYAAPGDSLSFEQVNTSFASANYSYLYKKGNLKANAFNRTNFDEYTYIRNNPSIYQNQHRTNVAGFEVGANYELLNSLILSLGAEARNERINSNNLGEHQRNVFSTYIDAKWSWNDRIYINPGAGYHNYTDFGDQLTYGVDARINIFNFLSVYGNYGTTFRTPTYNELYYEDFSNVGNGDLDIETALSYEVGVKFDTKAFDAQASYFVRNGTNIIDWQQVEIDTLMKWRPDNITNLPMQGYEFSAAWYARKSFILSPVRVIKANYTYLDGDAEVSNSMPSRYALEFLQHQFSLYSQFGILGILRGSIGYRYVDRLTMDSYNTLDIGFGFHFNKVAIDVVCNNVGGTEFEEFPGIQAPNRWWRVDVSYTLK